MERFINRAPGSTFYKGNGEQVTFTAGVYETSDPAEIQELKAAIAAGCTLIYQEVEVVVEEAEANKVVKLVRTKPADVPV